MRGIVVLSVLVGCGAQTSLGYLQPPPGHESGMSLGLFASGVKYVEQAQPPVSLKPTDGSELALTKLGVNVTIDGPIAHTQLRFSFLNTEKRTREGRFTMVLPPSAAVTKLSMEIFGEMREARVVSRERGREVFETFLRRNVDPALLEQDMGNTFSARVFPILANEEKEIVLEYDTEVSSARRYSLPLSGLPKIGELEVVVENHGKRERIDRRDSVPEDIVVDVPRGDAAVQRGEAFVARVEAVESLVDNGAPLDRVLYLIDTSASRAPVMAKQVRVLESLLAAQPANAQVAIVVFDQVSQELYRGSVRDAAHASRQILQHGALGSSNLGAALQRAATAGMSRVVILGDGVATAGEHDAEKLAAIVRGSSIERVDIVQVGQSIDRVAAQKIVAAGKKPGAIVDGTDPRIAAKQLATVVAAPVAIRVEGAEHSWPATTKYVAPGEPVFVYGLRKGTGPLTVRVDDRVIRIATEPGPDRLRRAVARAELATMIDERALDSEIEKLAMEHELVSPRTSLIVLESEAHERAFLGPKGGDPKSGHVIDAEYTRNIPTGRTFASVLGAAAGSQSDSYGVSFSGSTSLENHYYVDGVNTTGLLTHTLVDRNPRVRSDVMSPLALDQASRVLQTHAFALSTIRSDDALRDEPRYAAPYSGDFHRVMAAIAKRDTSRALQVATAWHVSNPGDVAGILALGEALEARGAANVAMRVYGSIADLYPNRADLLRVAGQRLDRIGSARELAVDFYRRAVRERPDHVTSYRLLAYALVRANRPDDALEIVLDGASKARRHGDKQLLAEDAAIIGSHIVARFPARRYEILPKLPLGFASIPTSRFVLMWETDATDVDLHVRQGSEHAHAKGKQYLQDGGRIVEDMRDGYGPEAFVIERPAGSYKLAVHYFDKGAMGLGLGTVQIVHHDGNGGITVEDRPFTLQNNNAMIELGSVK